MEKTSFPIGGIDTRACVSAHSGYPSQKFFDDIDELISDDIIYIRILNQKLTYKVFDKEVVEPDDITKLKVEHGKELLTLITCYPYGINSHRLLVHAKRVYTSGNAATASVPLTFAGKAGSPLPSKLGPLPFMGHGRPRSLHRSKTVIDRCVFTDITGCLRRRIGRSSGWNRP